MNKALSVSSLSNQVKSLLESTFMDVYVEGEISNLTYHNSGHIYFSLKDVKASISCVLFKGNAKFLKFRLEVGMKITISGSITVYTPRGNYQLLCSRVEPIGQGALALAYEQLKIKLKDKGYFEQSIKKTLGSFPKHIALVTSPTGAVIEDMKKIALHRWPLCKFTLVPTTVQGEGSANSIASAIKKADGLEADIIIVARGGGSIEDLWAFNEEVVADAIFNAKTTIVSAIGHESDFVISDEVADIRASTPSNAIEIVLPDINEYRMYLDSLASEYKNTYNALIYSKQQHIIYINKFLSQHSFSNRFLLHTQEITLLKTEMNNLLDYKLKNKTNDLEILTKLFIINNPKNTLGNSDAKIIKNGKRAKVRSIIKDDTIFLETLENIIKCRVTDILKIDFK